MAHRSDFNNVIPKENEEMVKEITQNKKVVWLGLKSLKIILHWLANLYQVNK